MYASKISMGTSYVEKSSLVRLFIFSLKSLVLGNWWVVLMTEELALINYLKYLDNTQLADH